ncbi:MAG: hypothetical protein WCH98_18850 [Verrucomicrobiota bacterium]
MKTPDFDELLAGYRQVAIPELPGSFSADVLREIRLRGAGRESGWFSSLFACLRPGMIAASLSLALAVGAIVPGLARGNGTSMAAAGLGLNVFSSSASNMPSGFFK